jgi:hypothetical protein
MTEKNQKPQIKDLSIKLAWEDASEIQTTYANNLLITHAGNEFYLIFGEMAIITEFDPNNLPDQLSIKPVVKIAITPENMERFSKAIEENMKTYKEKVLLLKDEDNDATNNE